MLCIVWWVEVVMKMVNMMMIIRLVFSEVCLVIRLISGGLVIMFR